MVKATEDKLEEAEKLIRIMAEPIEAILGRWDCVPKDCESEEHVILRVAFQAYIQWEDDYGHE